MQWKGKLNESKIYILFKKSDQSKRSASRTSHLQGMCHDTIVNHFIYGKNIKKS